MDQAALARLSAAFANVGKPKPKVNQSQPKRRRRRRRRGDPVTDGVRLYRAQNLLAKELRLKHEGGSVKHLAAKLTVSPVSKSEWVVSGGQCSHVVINREGVLTCIDHVPAHQLPLDGYACSHEVAVRRFLAREIMRKESSL